MKKIFALSFIIITFLSCSVDDAANEDFSLEILPIENVTIPTEVIFGQSYTINYTYLKPSTCHIFNDIYYLSVNNIRTVAVINTVINETETVICEPLTDELVERSFEFYVKYRTGSYIFKFWNGKDDNGEDLYLIYEIPIIS
jgi:hypothetical protein